VAEVKDLKRLPEYISRAFQVSQGGRPGPVIISLPEDILSGVCEVPDRPRVVLGQQFTSDSEVKKIEKAIIKAERPLVIAGGTGWSKEAVKNLGVFVKNFNLPVATTFRRQHLMDNRHDCYIGDLGTGMNPALAKTVKESDLIIAIGTRLGEIATGGYELIDPKKPEQKIIHIHKDPNELGHVYQPTLSVLSSTENILNQFIDLPKLVNPEWSARTNEVRNNYLNWITPKETPGPVKLEKIIEWLSNNLPEDSIVTNGAGNYAAFLHRYFVFKEYPTAIGPTSGSMGYGFPASIAAKLRFPDKTVICMAGDGCFQMTLNEMSTAAHNKLAIIVIVVNNGKYATIRMHQEKHYPGRVSGTEIHNPDFAALAKAYGGFGVKVQKTEDFVAAYDQAVASGLLSVIELKIDDEVLSTSQTVSEVRNNSSK
jgi:acetolactate synthase-1/2/3 large subunit